MSKSRIMQALILSKEELEDASAIAVDEAVEADPAVDEGAVVEDQVEVIEEPDFVDESVAEVTEAETEIAEDEAVIETLDDAAATLESIYQMMEADQEEGLSPQAARYASLAVESVMRTLGVEEPVMAALESFDSASARVGATALSMETMAKKAKEIWAAIVKFVKRIKDAIVNFFRTHISFAGRLQKRLEKLTAAAKAAGEFGKQKFEIEKSLNTRLAGSDGYIDTNLVEITSAINESTNLSRTAAAENKKLYKAIEKMAQDLKVKDGKRDYTAADLGLTATVNITPGKAFKNKAKGQDSVLETDVLPGGKIFYVGSRVWEFAGLRVPTYITGSRSVTVTDIKDLSVEFDSRYVADILKNVTELIKVGKDASDKMAQVENEFKAQLKEVEISDEASMTETAKVRLLMRAFNNGAANQTKATAALVSHSLQLCNGHLSLVQMTLSRVKASKKSEAEAAA